MARLNQIQHERAIAMMQCNRRAEDIVRLFGCTKATINSLRRRFQQTGSTSDRPRSGRPRVTTQADDNFIKMTSLRNRFQPATVTAATLPGRQVSADTIRRRLRMYGIRPRRPYRGPVLTQRHRRARLARAQRHQRWRRVDWNMVIFSDETRIQLRQADWRTRVFRRIGERFADACVEETDRFGGGSGMVWGGICGGQENANCRHQRQFDGTALQGRCTSTGADSFYQP
ncbi:uncharacterized protein LOC128550131 [Mercenaria mercenaria]|uniref:uncharacterized protein LOC128550131 n=1 Tax=Mercenaria mercenaria TaxID=6596 RepID=UPI00234E7507|nr:uncharacterized protein LOC128550131 [Mercenaria mercenaria]